MSDLLASRGRAYPVGGRRLKVRSQIPVTAVGKVLDARTMAVHELVRIFYERLWNEIDLGIADEILHRDVVFRGSVGVSANGRQEVCDYISMVTTALSDYRCEIESMITEGDRAAAKVRFSGLHTGAFLGHRPTGRRVEWSGAAFFTAEGNELRDIWVLGDLESLRGQLSQGS